MKITLSFLERFLFRFGGNFPKKGGKDQGDDSKNEERDVPGKEPQAKSYQKGNGKD
jgi:hypothetical protein